MNGSAHPKTHYRKPFLIVYMVKKLVCNVVVFVVKPIRISVMVFVCFIFQQGCFPPTRISMMLVFILFSMFVW